jgi:hypothetical protein
MFKLISMVFTDKSDAVDHIQDTGVQRMARMNAARQRTEELCPESETTDSDDKKDILSRARDYEVGSSWKGYTFRGKDERERRNGYIVKDWQKRCSHLPGFKVDPEY